MADPPPLQQGAAAPSAESPSAVPLASRSLGSQTSPAGSLPFWCYQCNTQVDLLPGAETICPTCGSGFLEEMETAEVGGAIRQQRRRAQGRHPRRLQVDLERFPPQQLVRILELFGQPIMHGVDASERRRHRRRRVRERQRERGRERDAQGNTGPEQAIAGEGTDGARPSDQSTQVSDRAEASARAERCDPPAAMAVSAAHGQASANGRLGENHGTEDAPTSRGGGASGSGGNGTSAASENSRRRSDMELDDDGEGIEAEDEEWDTADEDDDYEGVGGDAAEVEDGDEDDNDEEEEEDDEDEEDDENELEDDDEEEDEEEEDEEDEEDEEEDEDEDDDDEEEEVDLDYAQELEDGNRDEHERREQGARVLQIDDNGVEREVTVREVGIEIRQEQSAEAAGENPSAAGDAEEEGQRQREDGSSSGRAEEAAISRGRAGGTREEILLTATQRRSRRPRRRSMNDSIAVYVQNLMQDLFERNLSERNFELRFALPTTNFIGNPGDYLDARGFEQLLNQLAENDNSRRGAPPASKAVVTGLPTVIVTKEDTELGLAQCAVCKDNVDVGGEAKELPCSHRYHADCIFPWLANRNSCPVCRFELQTDDPDYEEQRRQSRGRGGGDAHGGNGPGSRQGTNGLLLPRTQESSPLRTALDRSPDASGSRRREEGSETPLGLRHGMGGDDGSLEGASVLEDGSPQQEAVRSEGTRRMRRVQDVRDQRVSEMLSAALHFDGMSSDGSIQGRTLALVSAGGRSGDGDVEGTANDLRSRLRGGNGASGSGGSSSTAGAATALQGTDPASQSLEEDGNADDRGGGGGAGASSNGGGGSSNWTTVRNTLLNVAVGVAFYFIGLHVVGFRDQRRVREGFTTEMGDFMQNRRRSWWQIF